MPVSFWNSSLNSGGRKFADGELMDRAMDALHRPRGVELLVTGELPGAQQMAYYWAVRNRIPEIITVLKINMIRNKS